MSIATTRTLKTLREKGYRAGVVERWLRYAGKFGKRQDLFGIIDIIAISPEETLGVQPCSGSLKKHIDKITKEKKQETIDWLSNPTRRLEIWSWRKLKKKLKKKAKKSKRKRKTNKKRRVSKMFIWKPRIVEITLKDLK
jgi:hypothetical protein